MSLAMDVEVCQYVFDLLKRMVIKNTEMALNRCSVAVRFHTAKRSREKRR